MEVNRAELQEALQQICEVPYGTSRPVIRVIALGSVTNCFFAISVPAPYRAQVYRFLVQRLSLSIPEEQKPLTITRRQAATLVNLILKTKQTVA